MLNRRLPASSFFASRQIRFWIRCWLNVYFYTCGARRAEERASKDVPEGDGRHIGDDPDGVGAIHRRNKSRSRRK
jgi:hypothetical protein